MEPTTPFWFKQRQCKLETAGDQTLKVSGPNLGEAYLLVTPGDNNSWKASLRLSPDGPDVATGQSEYPNVNAAWVVAFELYRIHLIV